MIPSLATATIIIECIPLHHVPALLNIFLISSGGIMALQWIHCQYRYHSTLVTFGLPHPLLRTPMATGDVIKCKIIIGWIYLQTHSSPRRIVVAEWFAEREEKVRYYVIGHQCGTTSTCTSNAVCCFPSLVGSPREEISRNTPKICRNGP